MDDRNRYTIAIIGGTGKEGKGLAYRWAKQGIESLLAREMKRRHWLLLQSYSCSIC